MSSQPQTERQQQIARRPHVYQESTQQYIDAPYQHQEFPKWKYHPTKGATLVHDAMEERNLGPEWKDQRIKIEISESKNAADNDDQVRGEKQTRTFSENKPSAVKRK